MVISSIAAGSQEPVATEEQNSAYRFTAAFD